MEEFRNIITNCWSKETCYPGMKEEWEITLPELGQCAVTSLLYQDYFGGDIYKIKVGNISHYFNIVGNVIIDLTVNQFFLKNVSYDDKMIKNRLDILGNDDTKRRYQILKKKYEQECAKLIGK